MLSDHINRSDTLSAKFAPSVNPSRINSDEALNRSLRPLGGARIPIWHDLLEFLSIMNINWSVRIGLLCLWFMS